MKKRLLFINDILEGGGTENSLIGLTNELPLEKYAITVLTIGKHKYPHKILKEGIKYLYLFDRPNIPQGFINKWLARLFASPIYTKLAYHFKTATIQTSHQFDAVISYKEGECLKLAAKFHAPKKIAWVHTDFATFHWSKTVFSDISQERQYFEKNSIIVTVSDRAKNGIVDALGIDADKIKVIHNLVDENKITRLAQKPIGIVKPQDTLFVSLGRLADIKQYDKLLKMYKNLNDGGYKFEAWIIGDGPQRRQLEAYVKQNGMANVRLLGEQKNPYKYLSKADWFVHPSKSESFGIVLLESAFLSIPILTSDCGISKELTENCGFGVAVTDIDGLECQLTDILEGKTLADNFAKSKAKVRSYFGRDSVLNSIKGLFD